MGDRIHEQCSMKPPRCPGRRKNPHSGCHTELGLQSWQLELLYTYRDGTDAVEYLKPTRPFDGIQGFLKQFSKIVKKVIKC